MLWDACSGQRSRVSWNWRLCIVHLSTVHLGWRVFRKLNSKLINLMATGNGRKRDTSTEVVAAVLGRSFRFSQSLSLGGHFNLCAVVGGGGKAEATIIISSSGKSASEDFPKIALQETNRRNLWLASQRDIKNPKRRRLYEPLCDNSVVQ